MPISNWVKVISGDLDFIFKTEGILCSRAYEHWDTLQEEYLTEFGIDETYKQILRLEYKLMNLNLDYVITRDRFLFNVIKITEAEIQSLKQGEGAKFFDMLDLVEKYKGFAIDPDDYSVKKWYYSLRNMSKNGQDD